LNISIAIPDSSLIDESEKMAKTKKISLIARACSIFKVKEIYIYQEPDKQRNDSKLLITVLKYLVTPPFLRKSLYPLTNLLKYAGILSPLQIPSHTLKKNPKDIKIGDVRTGLIIKSRSKKFCDVGIGLLVPYFGKQLPGKRVIVIFKAIFPNFLITEITQEKNPIYWGYRVKQQRNLQSLILNWNGSILYTSRNGQNFSSKTVKKYSSSKNPILIVFGSPKRGLYEILGKKFMKTKQSETINFFPKQGTQTVRLEEAILGILAIFNAFQPDYF